MEIHLAKVILYSTPSLQHSPSYHRANLDIELKIGDESFPWKSIARLIDLHRGLKCMPLSDEMKLLETLRTVETLVWYLAGSSKL